MIGFQCSPANANGLRAGGGSAGQHESSQANLKREPTSVLSSLNSHINLINQAGASAPPAGSPTSTSSGTSSSSSTTTTTTSTTTASCPTSSAGSVSNATSSSVSPQLAGHSALQSAVSPGYHSAASSPSSSAASPVSSSSAGSSGGCSMGASSGGANSGPAQHQPASSPPSLSSSSTTSGSGALSRASPHSASLLDYYPELNQDGLCLSWFHDANNRAKLNAALMSNKMLVAGDISLAEMSRYPVPIMARPPMGVSDITLENWLQEMVHAQPHKGIKLTFTSTRTVEPAFRVLARHAELLKGPLILNADILTRPQSGGQAGQAGGRSNRQQQQQMASVNGGAQQPVDAWTFLMLCRTRFPKCVISIGWCSQTSSTCQQQEALLDSGSSLHSSADSMFELDMLDPTGMGAAQLGASHLGHLQHLGHQHRLHQQLHPYPTLAQHQQHQQQQQLSQMNHRQLINQQLSQQLSLNQHHHHHHHSHHHHHHQLGHHILSSTGSLNSSSGNSSGSPSPTSPISHLMSPPHQTVATNLTMHGGKGAGLGGPDSTEQLFLAAAEQQQKAAVAKAAAAAAVASSGSSSSAAAAAAAMAAAVVAATTFHQQQHHQQLPLNLNINEADQQLSSSQQQLSQLAHQFKSYQTMNQHNLITHQQLQAAADSSAAALSSRLFGAATPAGQQQQHHHHNQPHQQHQQHPHKRPALGGSHSGAPSPHSSSPKQATGHSDATAGQLLLKTTGSPAGSANSHAGGMGYTREMIDKMVSLVKEYNLTQPVTFPVEARMLRNSLGELQRLLYQVGANSTLTVVAQQDDLISVDELLAIRRAFATNQVLFDLPDELAASFRQELELL